MVYEALSIGSAGRRWRGRNGSAPTSRDVPLGRGRGRPEEGMGDRRGLFEAFGFGEGVRGVLFMPSSTLGISHSSFSW